MCCEGLTQGRPCSLSACGVQGTVANWRDDTCLEGATDSGVQGPPGPRGTCSKCQTGCSEPLWGPRWEHLCLEGGRLWACRAEGDFVTW